MTKTLQGIVHGRTIELMGDPGIADGQQVQVVLTAPGEATPGEGIMRTAGALADDPYWDDVMAKVPGPILCACGEYYVYRTFPAWASLWPSPGAALPQPI